MSMNQGSTRRETLDGVTFRGLVVAGALAGMMALLIGCGGGAKEKPTVTVKGGKDKTSETANGESEDKGSSEAGGKSDGGAAPAAGGHGTFTGRVVLKGDAPKLPLLAKKGDEGVKDAAVCAAMDLPNEAVVVGADGGLKNVFIYLVKAPAGTKKAAPAEEAAVFDQKNCQFLPHAALYRVNRTIQVLSDDKVTHNTHTFPLNGATSALNSAVAPNDRSGTVTFTYAGPEKVPVTVKCDIHPFMIAYQLPLDHDLAAVTDENGKFEIKDVPSGNHEFIVWHEAAGYLDRKYKVSISADTPTEKELSYDAGKFKTASRDSGRTIHLTLNH